MRVGAAIQQSRDVRMFEVGENLSFRAKPRHDRIGVHAAVDQLDRDVFLERRIGAHSAIHAAHAAFADQCFNAVRADELPEARIRRRAFMLNG